MEQLHRSMQISKSAGAEAVLYWTWVPQQPVTRHLHAPGPVSTPGSGHKLSKHLWPAWSCHKGTTCPTLCGQVLPASTQERAGAFGDLWARVSPCDSHFMCPLDWKRSVWIKRYYAVRLGGCFWMRLILELTDWVK